MIRNFLIESSNKSYGSSSNFNIILDEPIKVDEVRLLHSRIPVTWYNIDSFNNNILFNEGAGNLTATIPVGNYAISELVSEIKTQMDIVGSDTYTVTYNTKTMKLTIASTGTFSLLFNTSTSEIWEMIGFTKTNTSVGASHTGTNVIDLVRIKYIQIIIAELGLFGRSTNTNYEYTFIIPVTENRSDILHFNDENNFNQLQRLNGRIVNNMNIILRDQKNRTINLNGSEISILIALCKNVI